MSMSFPVIEEHPAWAANYCECCGARVDHAGNTVDEPDDEDLQAADAIRRLALLCVESPLSAIAVLYKIAWPHASQRDITRSLTEHNAGDRCGSFSRRQVNEAFHHAARHWPQLAGMLGLESAPSTSQQARREKEKNTQQMKLL